MPIKRDKGRAIGGLFSSEQGGSYSPGFPDEDRFGWVK